MKISEIAERYIELRDERGLSDADFSKISGIPQPTLCNLKKGCLPGGQLLEAICIGFNMDPSEFFCGNGYTLIETERVEYVENIEKMSEEFFERQKAYAKMYKEKL